VVRGSARLFGQIAPQKQIFQILVYCIGAGTHGQYEHAAVRGDMAFNEADHPVGAPNELKQNLSGPHCDAFIIATLTRLGNRTIIEQEVVDA
jgi:hypothetical protein